MGRHKKYKTEHEQLESQRRWGREYYYRHKERISKERMRKYYAKVGKKMLPDDMISGAAFEILKR